jgi:lipid II:glycine glycyltransferase (peptidoglycan interpeptide bridge formation enzyme)
MSNERRKNINKSLKDGLHVKKIDDYEVIKSLAMKTFLRQDMGINEFYLDKVLFEFANNKNSYAFGTFMNDKPIACTFCVYDKNTAYYLIGGYDNKNKHHGAGALSMWEAIKFAKKTGLKNYDFEGSMEQQIERYFRGFGGQITPYYRINKAKLPLEILLKFYKRELF